MSLTSLLFRAARASADLRAVRRSVESGSPKPALRRAKNKLVGRRLGGLLGPFWRWPK